MAYSGRFKPTNPEKYNGDHTKIIYRSLWEAKFFRYVDKHPAIKWWASEELSIPYLSPKDNKYHRYFPDVIMCVEDPVSKKQKTIMIEIKPKIQTAPPNISKKNATPTGRVSRRFLRESLTYEINMSKWAAARAFCAKKGWDFEIMTEKDLGV